VTACSSVAITTPALDMPLDWRVQACDIAFDLAVLNNQVLVIRGEAEGFDYVICVDEDCAACPRVLVVVPDVEVLARFGGDTPQGAMVMQRADGRSCLVFRGPP